MEKITSIRKLRRFAKREGKDFSYKDLSGLDLSKIEPEFWEGATFYYTNLSNTGIKFRPRRLAEESIEGCNLEGVDLSDSTDEDWFFIDIKNANLRDTGLRISLHYRSGDLGTVLLDENYGNLDSEEFDGVNLNFEMLEMNPFIKITPQKLSEMIETEIHDISVFITESKATTLLKKCEERLEEYDDGTLTSLYARMCEGWSTMDKLSFFNQSIIGKKFDKLDLSGISAEVIGEFIFKKCIFEEIILDNPLPQLTGISIFNSQNENEFGKITFTALDSNAWRHITKYTRIGRVTFKRFIYLEIGKKCNARCLFCRNKSFSESKERDMDAIIANLKKMEEEIDTIFIGGGEPALYWNDVIKIYRNVETDIVIVTNGSLPVLEEDYKERMSIYISRHALSDEENQKILNIISSDTKILSIREIKEMARVYTVALTPVCIKGGLDTAEKMQKYIEEFLQGDIESIIFSNLHNDASLGAKEMEYEDLCIDIKVFKEVQQELLKQNFVEKEPICSTGGYILKRYEKESYSVSFKIYLSKEELNKYWESSMKRTFDFTMTPAGELYQDWNRGLLVEL